MLHDDTQRPTQTFDILTCLPTYPNYPYLLNKVSALVIKCLCCTLSTAKLVI